MGEQRPNNLLICALEPVQTGEMFEDLPLHVTIQRWFTLGGRLESAFRNSLINYAYRTAPINIEMGENEDFGQHREVPVRKLRRLGSLAMVHHDTAEIITRFDGEISDPEWSGKKYTPHVSYVNGVGPAEGDQFTLNSLQFVRRDDNDMKEVIGSYYFRQAAKNRL